LYTGAVRTAALAVVFPAIQCSMILIADSSFG
jgi:hypothetical protein